MCIGFCLVVCVLTFQCAIPPLSVSHSDLLVRYELICLSPGLVRGFTGLCSCGWWRVSQQGVCFWVVGLHCISYMVDGLCASSFLVRSRQIPPISWGFPIHDPNAGGHLAVSHPLHDFPPSPLFACAPTVFHFSTAGVVCFRSSPGCFSYM